MNSEINEKLKTLPDRSGVYIMHNAEGEIIYVGKAKNLKNRVRSYFKSHNHPPKVASMVSVVDSFEYIITDSELEALVLENNLIKENMPKYNILLKDDKTYPFMKITVNEHYPRVLLTRRVKNDGAKYFGPYQSSYDLKQLITLIRSIYKIRSCQKEFAEDYKVDRPCLYYQLKKCSGACIGAVSAEQYRRTIDSVIEFAGGKTAEAEKMLTEQMRTASETMDFERAADCRDSLKAIEILKGRQKIVNPNGNDTDVIGIFNKNNTACVQLFFIRSGKMIGREHYFISDTEAIPDEVIISDFMRQYYETSTFIPNVILTEKETDDADVIRAWLCEKAGRSVKIVVPKIGENAKLVRMIKANAKKEHSERELKILRDIGFKNAALTSLGQMLDLKKPPMLIEAYDISNMGANSSVAAMVVFKDGKPCTKKYRNFRIKNVDIQDDYASMREVIRRRFTRAITEQNAVAGGELSAEDAKFLPLPDVVFADGGENHRNAVKQVLDELGIDIPVFGIVKDDNHRTRAIAAENGEIKPDKRSEAFMLLISIQDEMHRRAITYLRESQKKKTVSSELDLISGVGEKRRKTLLSHFKSMKKIREATVSELAAVKGIDTATAQKIYDYFNGK